MSFIPVVGDVDTTFRDVSKLLLEDLNRGGVNAQNTVGNSTTILANAGWVGAEQIRNAAISHRLSFAAFIISAIRALFDSIFLAYLLIAGSEHRDVVSGWDDLRDFFIDNAKTIQTRTITFDPTPTVTGTGDPVWRRLTTDEEGFEIQSVYGESTTVKVGDTQPNTRVGEEVYRMSLPAGIDVFSFNTAGEKNSRPLVDTLTSENDDNDLIGSSSMEVVSLATAQGSVSNLGTWIVLAADLANISIVEDGYRESVTERSIGKSRSPEATVKLAARLHGNMSFFQDIETIDNDLPHDWGFYIRRTAAIAGVGRTATLTVGTNATATVADISALTLNAWTKVSPTLDQQLYPRNFLGNDPKVTFQVAGLVGAEVVDIDTFHMRPFKQFNGSWWHVEPGLTATLENYKAVFDDLIAAEGTIGKLIFLAYGFNFQLPHSGTPTIAAVV